MQGKFNIKNYKALNPVLKFADKNYYLDKFFITGLHQMGLARVGVKRKIQNGIRTGNRYNRLVNGSRYSWIASSSDIFSQENIANVTGETARLSYGTVDMFSRSYVLGSKAPYSGFWERGVVRATNTGLKFYRPRKTFYKTMQERKPVILQSLVQNLLK